MYIDNTFLLKKGTSLKAAPSLEVEKTEKKHAQIVQEVIEITSDEEVEQVNFKASAAKFPKQKLTDEERLENLITLTSDSESDEDVKPKKPIKKITKAKKASA
jgi:hypothetical protein